MGYDVSCVWHSPQKSAKCSYLYIIIRRRIFHMKLIPLADRVVLKQVKAEEKTKSGLILASAAQEKPEIFEVIEVGPGGVVDGKEVVMTVQQGQKVITGKYTGTTVKIEGEELLIVKQADILAIVSE